MPPLLNVPVAKKDTSIMMSLLLRKLSTIRRLGEGWGFEYGNWGILEFFFIKIFPEKSYRSKYL